jgi:primosomal protein N' (replication factor Y) (superfamily II helicase)
LGEVVEAQRVQGSSQTLIQSAVPSVRVARVVPDVTGVDKIFDYLVPEALAETVRVGVRVRVPLHGRNVAGWVVEIGEPSAGLEVKKIKSVIKVLGLGATAEIVDLAVWATKRWAGRMRSFISTAAPETLINNVPSPRYMPRAVQYASDTFDKVRDFGGGLITVAPLSNLAPFISAVACDGPTIVVMPTQHRVKLLAAALRANNFSVAQWPQDWALAYGGVDVVIGTRSAVWAPVEKFSNMVVVDEHDDLLQEERSPTWHARDVAIERSSRVGARCILLSPIASLSARKWAGDRRVVDSQGQWPEVLIVDRNNDEQWSRSLISSELIAELRDKSRRVVCVLNSKGRARLTACGSCRNILRCEKCDAALNQTDKTTLDCPRCGESRPVICQVCGSSSCAVLKPGVARLREELEAAANRSVFEVTAATETVNERCNVFVGTEAVLHRVQNADTVVFLDIDSELLAPRYRANEIVATLVVHAARLVGRSTQSPRILLQTHTPDNAFLIGLKIGDLSQYFVSDEARRSLLKFPPFGSIAQVSGKGTKAFLDSLNESLEFSAVVQTMNKDTENGLIRAENWQQLSDVLLSAKRPAKSRLTFHVDPPRV